MRDNPSLVKHPGLDDCLAFGADGRSTLRTGKVDSGQRISTAVALIAAEELDVEPARLDVVRAATGSSPDEGITSGSNSMEESGHAIRLVAATARRLLLARAATALGVDAASLDVTDGLIQSRDTNRTTTYWELAGDEPFDAEVDLAVEIQSNLGRQFLYRDGAVADAQGRFHFRVPYATGDRPGGVQVGTYELTTNAAPMMRVPVSDSAILEGRKIELNTAKDVP